MKNMIKVIKMIKMIGWVGWGQIQFWVGGWGEVGGCGRWAGRGVEGWGIGGGGRKQG